MNYRMIYDIHSHTNYSHATGTIEENVQAAAAKGLTLIGISEHGPGHLSYGAKRESFALMRKEVDRLRPLYPQIEIQLGVEANIINAAGDLDVGPEENDLFDYVLAGYHYGAFGSMPLAAVRGWLFSLFRSHGKKGIAANTKMIINAIERYPLKVLTHPGAKIKINIRDVAKACAARGTLMEISNRYDALSVEDIRICAEENVSFIINSDGHKPEEIGCFEKALERARLAGLDLSRIVNLTPEK
ncbi:MAG: PHP domain-containing protein [Firmicutes bacterium]|nr:PHP domain-containing protein [Clostridiales bacterium]MBQ9931944.1 PHP domain-containing protein [Bacillota bacterium]